MTINRPANPTDPGRADERLLAAVPDSLRPTVKSLLKNPRQGGRGLRAWVGLIEADPRPLPTALPGELLDVYLSDADAEPLHDCADCGLPVPVRVGRRVGHEPTCDRVYFTVCPNLNAGPPPWMVPLRRTIWVSEAASGSAATYNKTRSLRFSAASGVELAS